MPPGSGVIVGGTGNTKSKNPELEKMEKYVDIKVQIIFSSISYSKFLKQKARSTKFITNEKGGNASDYFLYCAEDWPEKAYMYNDAVDEVIFIDCGSDDFGSAKKNGENETVLRKYISFAIMRLKDMLYRRSQLFGQRGKAQCMIVSIFPFHKCMLAMSALLGKMLTDSDSHMSFIADVISRVEYRYTFNWIRTYGWSFEVYYNAAFSPYLGSVGCRRSPKMKLNDINNLLGKPESRRKAFYMSNMPSADMWVDKKFKKNENGDVTTTWGESQNGKKKKVTFYDKKDKDTTTYDGKDVTLTEWVPQDKETEVWVPDDPTIQKWQDPESGKLLVRYEGQIYERDYLYDYLDSALHPSYDQLHERIGETHKAYDEATKRADDFFQRAIDAQAAGDDVLTKEYIDEEVDNLVSQTGMTPEEAKASLAEQGFIPQNQKGENMYFADGRLVTNDGLVEMLKVFQDAEMKALKDYLNAQKALEQRKNSDTLFVLTAASLVVGVVSFGAASVAAAAAFAIVDIGLNVSVVLLQIGGAKIEGKGAMDAFGSTTGERAFNIALTGIAIIADCISFVPLFKGPKGIPTSNSAVRPKVNKIGETRKVTNAKGELEFHTNITYEDGSVELVKLDKNGNSSREVIKKAGGETQTHTTAPHDDGNAQAIKKNEYGETISNEHTVYNGDVIQNTVTPNGVEKRYKNGQLEYEIDPKTGTKKTIKRNSNGEIDGIVYSKKTGPNGEWSIEGVETYKDGVQTGKNGIPVENGAKIDKNGVRIDEKGAKIDGDGATQGGAGESKVRSGDSGGSNGTNANNAETPMTRENNNAEDVANEGSGSVSSNTGNGEKLIDKIKAAIWENSGMSNLPGVSEHGVIDWLKHDFIKLGFAADHWMCVFVAIKSLIESDRYQTIATESPKAGIVGTDGKGEINKDTSLKDLTNMSAQDSLNNSSKTLKEMESRGDTSSQQYFDTVFVNEAAAKAIAAQEKADALKTYYDTDDEIQRIKQDTGGLNFNNQHNRDLVEKRDEARQTVTNYDANQAAAATANAWGGNLANDVTPSPSSDDFNNNYKHASDRGLAIAQAEAEAQGAQADLEMEKYLALFNQKHPNQ